MTTTLTATVRDFNDKPVTVKVGDVVGFKSDYEQQGRIVNIEPARSGYGLYNLTLYNEDGFGGEYLRYAKTTVERSDDCWV